MPRTVLVSVLVLAFALSPTAAALAGGAPTAVDAGVGPNGPVLGQTGEPYYLLAHVGAPEAPREASDNDDCSYDPERPGSRTPPLETALRQLAAEVASWDPREEPRVSGWYPRCFAGTLLDEGAPVSGRVAYDVPTGRYYVEIDTHLADGMGTLPIPFGAVMGGASATLVRLTGTTGLGTEADCETCPPPI